MKENTYELNDVNKKLLQETLSKYELCMGEVAGAHGQDDVLRRLAEIEAQTWSESPVEVDNRPLVYRHLVSLLEEPSIVEERYAECEHNYLKAILAQRYWELLGNIVDMEKLMELAVHAHPGLRLLAILRFQEHLLEALEGVSPTEMPHWFIRLLAQPHEMANFLSHASSQAVVKKMQALLAD